MIAGGAAIAATIGLLAMVFMAGGRTDALLFSGLSPAASGDIIGKLDEMAVPYTIDGSAIYVPEGERDRLRLELARLGMPPAGGAGYEILDDLNGFSTTSDMFDAAYWRAKEGELTRTILAIPTVTAARVHLGVTRQSAFRRARLDKSASVTVEASGGLSKSQAQSIQYLTALAVPELRPESVAVIDTARGVIAGPGATGDESPMGDEIDREDRLASRLTHLLEAHVGPGNARVSVAMDIDRQSIAQKERVIDPDSRQIVSRSISEESDAESDADIPVTIASNLPDGDAAEDPEEAGTRLVKRRRDEEVTYTGTEIERVIETAAGTVRRLSVAVLLNERYTVNEEGETVPAPRSPEEVEALETLVANAAGIEDERGDRLAIRVLPFEGEEPQLVTAPGFVEAHVMPRAVDIAQFSVLALLVASIAFFVLRPALSPKTPFAQAEIAEGEDKLENLDAAEVLTMLTEENPDDAAAILDSWFEEDRRVA
ncbi:flagellar M-ring protein FliF [Parvularcula bermudensis HTCC2503]|uniref:Flagellar M-ring protein n=1 Tax=Parvularcula bermudensis (strain ATCC BAA-594 / HTCC2503 / KCTC 12087) TaxID=314260 RepID=E0TH44_PARBH|nr:flagellar M-ring protein FliF [Parvularcula bermudensis HTCC2503]